MKAMSKRVLTLLLALAVLLNCGLVSLAAPAGMAETELLVEEDYEIAITDGAAHSIPFVSEWKSGTSTADLKYQDGRVYLNKLNSGAYAADMVIPMNKGWVGGQEPATPDTDIYLEFDWKAHNTSTRLYIQGQKQDGKGVNLFYLVQYNGKLQYNKGDNSGNVVGSVAFNQTASHVIRLLMKRSGDSYTITKSWIDGVLDKEMSLAAPSSCVGLYCFKTDERRNSGTGLGSSFGSLKVWQPAEAQLKEKLEGGSPVFDDIRGANESDTKVTGDLSLQTGGLTATGLLITGWESSNPDVIDESGAVTRPQKEDVTVKLTPTLAILDTIGDGSSDFQPAEVTAQGSPITVTVRSMQLQNVKDQLTFETIKGKNETADAVTMDVVLPPVVEDVSIVWEIVSITPAGTSAEIDLNTGSVRRPLKQEQDVQVVLRANLTRGDETDAKEITFMVQKMDESPEEYVQKIAQRLSFADIAGENTDSGNVTGNLNLIRTFSGAELVWSSSNPEVITKEGRVNCPVYPDPAVEVVLTANLTYNGTANASKQLSVTVQPRDPENLAKTGEVKSNISGVSAADLERLRDEDETTGIEIPARTGKFYITFHLPEKKPVSKLEYVETVAEESEAAIESYAVAVSDNGTAWTNVFEGTGTPGRNIAEFSPVEASYVKLEVLKKTTGKSCLLSETAVRFRPSDQALVDADAKAFASDVPARITDQTMTLPLNGKYGSTIRWSFQPADAIVETAVKGTYQVNHSKDDKVVAMTATFGSNSASAQLRSTHTITGTGSGSGSGGGGGGGGSSVTSGSGNKGSSPINLAPTAPVTPPVEEPEYFKDLGQAEWSREYVEALYQEGIIAGKGDGLFCPMDSVTREEFVKLLVCSLGLEAAGTVEFEDVQDSGWYAPYVAAAVENQLANGISETQFGVGATITREDAVVMLARSIKGGSEAAALEFADAAEISDYAKDSVALAVASGLIQGNEEGYFRPKDELSRAEAAKILYLLRSVMK